jgi:hypothetical protein
MLARDDVIGQQISEIVGASTDLENDIHYTDFIYVLANGMAFRMPSDDESGNWLPEATAMPDHLPLIWPADEKEHFQLNLWSATIAEILVPLEIDDRYPDSGVIKLSSGWYLIQSCSAPFGVTPYVQLVQDPLGEDAFVSVWDAAGYAGQS